MTLTVCALTPTRARVLLYESYSTQILHLSSPVRVLTGSLYVAIAAALLVAAWPDLDSLSIRLVIASAIEFAFVAVLCRKAGQARRAATAVASLAVASGDSGRKR